MESCHLGLLDIFRIPPQRLFLWISLLSGLFFAVLSPPFSTPDELQHFYRIMSLSQGELLDPAPIPRLFLEEVNVWNSKIPAYHYRVTPTDIFPPNYVYHFSEILDSLFLHSFSSPLQIPAQSRAVCYTPFSYFPAIATTWLAMKLGLSPLAIMYLCRIVLWLSSTFLLYWAISITPTLRWQMFFLVLLPTTSYVRSGMSADPLTIGYIFLFIALILDSLFVQKTINTKRIFLLSTFSILVCLSKSAYLPLALLFFIIPTHYFSSPKKYFSALFLTVILPVVIGVAWTLIASKAFSVIPALDAAIAPKAQIDFLLSHPTRFLSALAQSLVGVGLLSKIGTMTVLIDMDEIILAGTIIAGLILFIIFPFQRITEQPKLNRYQSVLCAFIFCSIVVLIHLILYIVWTPVGHSTVVGLHGRYFTPIMPLLFLAFSFESKQVTFKRTCSAVIIFSVLGQVLSIYSLLEKNY